MGQTLPAWNAKTQQTAQCLVGERQIPSVDAQLSLMDLDEKIAEHNLYLARVKLLDNTKLHMPYADAARYDSVIIQSQRTVYNPYFRCGNAADTEMWLKSQFSELEQVLKNHVFVRGGRAADFYIDVATRMRSVYSKCFFTGQSLRYLKFTRLVPDFSHPCNFVPICGWLSGITVRGVVNETVAIELGSGNGGQVWVSDHGLAALHKLATCDLTPTVDEQKTRIDELGFLTPRSTLRGWIARIVLTLMDMYGSDSISKQWIDPELLVRWAALPLSVEELMHDVMVYSLTKDTSPFIHLNAKERERYAISILQRSIDQKQETKQQETRSNWTIITSIKGYIAQDKHGDSQLIFEDVIHDDPQIEVAIQQFKQSLVTLNEANGDAAGLP